MGLIGRFIWWYMGWGQKKQDRKRLRDGDPELAGIKAGTLRWHFHRFKLQCKRRR